MYICVMKAWHHLFSAFGFRALNARESMNPRVNRCREFGEISAKFTASVPYVAKDLRTASELPQWLSAIVRSISEYGVRKLLVYTA